MTIASGDVKLFQSVGMADFDEGGGPMSPTPVVDGADNNVFDDVTEVDRVNGRVSVRKVYGAVLSDNDDTLLSAYAAITKGPTDDTTDVVILYSPSVLDGDPVAEVIKPTQRVGAVRSEVWTEAMQSALPTGVTHTRGVTFQPSVFGIAELASAADADATALDVDRITAGIGLDGTGAFVDMRAFFPDDIVLIHHEAEHTATRANSDVFDAGRTNLSRIRVVDADGVEVARFDKGVAPPTGVGCEADLVAGTLTFTDVSGMAQPVTVQHRIEELRGVDSVSDTPSPTITLTRGVLRAYPSGSHVSPVFQLGDLRGRVSLPPFAQAAWAAIWQDTRIDVEPLADYNNTVFPITTTNEGAITERWVILFTNSTTFKIVGEQVGEIGGGTTGVACAPINPATGAPYFTINPSGWGTSWAAGLCLRFNTAGASAPLWLARTVEAAEETGDDAFTLEFRGYVNA